MQLVPTTFVTHVNNISAPDLSAFLAEIKKIEDNEYFRLTLKTLNDVPLVVTMKKNEHYFPTIELTRDTSAPLGWKAITHECTVGGSRWQIGPDELKADAGDE